MKENKFGFFLNFRILAIFLILFYIAIRIPYLGFSNFNTDSFKWKTRIYDFGSGVFNLNLDQTVQKYHPGVTLMWVGAFSVKFYNFIYEFLLKTPPIDNDISFVFSLNFYQIFFLVCFQALLIFLMFYFLAQIYDPFKAFLIVLTVSLEPYFLGITTTLHLDGILNLFIVNFLICLYLFIKNSERFHLYLSAIFFAFALLTKTTALLFFPLVLLVFIAKYYLIKKIDFKDFFKNLLIFSTSTFLIYFIFWPAMWYDPVGTLKYVYEGINVGTEDHSQIFFGSLVNDPGPSYYLIVTFIKATIYIFPALLLAAYIQLNTTYRKYTFEIFIFLSSILYLIEISVPSKKLDRYIFVFLMLISMVIYSYLYDFSKKILVYFIGINLFFVFYLNFDYFSYYNPLGGGLKTSINWVEPKWIFGQKEVISYFSQELYSNRYEEFSKEETISKVGDINNKLIVAVPEKYYTQLYPYFRFINSWAVINTIKPEAIKAKYFIFPVWEDNSKDPELLKNFNFTYYDEIKVRGVSIFNVYKVNVREN
jgi:hypothetical protein